MRTKQSVVILLFTFISAHAFAWGAIGHGVVGEIAEQNLTPKAKDFVRSILGSEPLAVAANWPDHIRSDAKYRAFSPYHFIEIPYKYDSYEEVPLKDRADKNSDVIISRASEVLNSTKYSREQKMIFLRFLVHVVGDVHMPLHVGNGQDMGANLCDVKWKDPLANGFIKDTNLHSVWDDSMIDVIAAEFKSENGVINSKRWFGYKELTDIILKEKYDGVNLSGTPVEWYQESRELHKKVYPDTTATTPDRRKYCKFFDSAIGKVVNGAYDPSQIPTLTKPYVTESLKIIKQRLLQGGHRLAKLINAVSENADNINAPTESEILDGILLTNPKSLVESKTVDFHKGCRH